MQIKCSFCGALVDPAKTLECPNCGAQIGENKQYQQYQEDKQNFYSEMRQLELEEKQGRIEKQKLENEQLRRSAKQRKTSANSVKMVKIIAAIIIAPFALFVLFGLGIVLIAVNSPDIIDPAETTEPYVEPYHEAVAGEIVQTRDYQLVLDKWGYYTPKSYSIKDGEKYIKFHFTYTNTSEREIYDKESVHCYDSTGKDCDSPGITDEDYASKLKSQSVMPGRSYSGWLYYSLPESETEVTVTYGESIEIKVSLNETDAFFDQDTATIYYEGKFGEVLQTKKLEILFDSWGYYKPEITVGGGEKFIKLHVVYKNIGTKDIDVYDYIPCYDSNGAEYHSTTVFLTDNDKSQAIKDQEVVPGKSYSGWYYFEIPEHVEELTLMPYTNVEIHVDLTEVVDNEES